MLQNNQEDLTALAVRYRLNLDNNSDELLKPIYENLFLNQINERFKWYETRSSEIIKSGNYNFFLKNLKTFCYSFFKTFDSYKSTLETKDYSLENEIKEIEIFYKKQISNFESIKKDLNSSGSKFYVKESFSQRNLEESYDLVDEKRKSYFPKYNLAKCSDSQISSSIKETFKIKPFKADVLGSSANGEKIESSKYTSYLWRPSKRFKYIVYQNEKMFKENPGTKKASLEILFDFGFVQKVNKMILDEGSYFSGTLDESNFKYYNETNKQWEILNVNRTNRQLKKINYFFDEVETNKIIVKIDHYKSLNKVPESFLTFEETFNLEILSPTNNQNPLVSMYNVFDLSIDEINFEYEIYKKKSIYRERSAIEVPKAEYFSLGVESEVKENCFLECEMEIQVFNPNGSWNWSIIPIPRSYKVKEVLFFKDGNARLTFPVKDGNIEHLTVKDLTGEVINFDSILKIDQSNYQIYNDYIESETLTLVEAEYIVHDSIDYDIGKYENNLFTFNGKIKGKKVLLRPRFIFRNINDENKSASIHKYTVETNKTDFNKNVSSKYEILKGS